MNWLGGRASSRKLPKNDKEHWDAIYPIELIGRVLIATAYSSDGASPL